MSHVTCHISNVTCIFEEEKSLGGGDKVVELVDGGYVINEAYPV